MIRIAVIGDLHIQGSTVLKCKEAFRQVHAIIDGNVDHVVILGDVFHRSNISDRFASTGDLQRVILEFIISVISTDIKVWIVEGNHDQAGVRKSSLEFLKGYSKLVQVIDSPKAIGDKFFGGATVGFLPWIEKGVYFSKHCVGLDKTEADQKFTQAVHSVLGVIKDKFKDSESPNLLFGHCELQGLAVNAGYIISGGSGYTFTEGQLYATGADYICLGHIHKRMNAYCGALYQNNFGEEGNDQGFEILTIDGNSVYYEYITLDLPQFKTIEIHKLEDTHFRFIDGWSYKLRFYNEYSFNSFDYPENSDVIIEKLWGKSDHVSRTEMELTAQMSEEDLLNVYIDLNALPEGITVKELMEAAK